MSSSSAPKIESIKQSSIVVVTPGDTAFAEVPVA
jgi:hypothetical protein